MNVKIHSQGIAGGHNSGSCGGYAAYLEHENIEKAEAGMQDKQIPFFNLNGASIAREVLVLSLDRNTTQLHQDDAKFYSVILSFSEEEVKSMGGSRGEVIASVHRVVERTMDQYAKNFHCDAVNSHADLKYYYTIHEYRSSFEPGLHVHIIVSRKDATNHFKLSPMTNHRGGSSGVIKRGFDRDSFYRSCEQIFDKVTGFERSLDKSYDYIEQLKEKQEGLKMAKADTLKSYIAVKDEKESLKSEINALKELLENAPALSKETLSELSKLIKEGGFMDKVAAAHRKEPSDVGLSLYEIFQSSEDRLFLDLNLLTRNFSCDPVYHSNGGVADFKVIRKGETPQEQ